MKITIVAGLGVHAAVGITFGSQDHGKQDAHAAPDVAKLFRDRCITCHQPPDPQFAVDRAWLGQIKDTA